MEKHTNLLGYFDKQIDFVEKIYRDIKTIDASHYDKRYVFAMRVQQFYTALEDLFKHVAKTFENHVESLTLLRMSTEISKIRPDVISKKSLELLNRLRAFRLFIWHAYDCELDQKELQLIQDKLKNDYTGVQHDLKTFRLFLQSLSNE